MTRSVHRWFFKHFYCHSLFSSELSWGVFFSPSKIFRNVLITFLHLPKSWVILPWHHKKIQLSIRCLMNELWIGSMALPRTSWTFPQYIDPESQWDRVSWKGSFSILFSFIDTWGRLGLTGRILVVTFWVDRHCTCKASTSFWNLRKPSQ